MTDHTSISTKLPLAPEALRNDAASLAFSEAIDGTAVVLLEALLKVLLDALLDEPVELLFALDDAAVEELEELDEPAVGWKVWCPGPKPTSDAKVPPTVIFSV
jgi:hypothetical protein